MELRQYWQVIWKWMWLILLATGLAGAGSLYATRQMPRIYQAATTLIVGQSIQSPNPSAVDLSTSQQLAQTYAQIVRTDIVLQGVVKALGLQADPQDVGAGVSTRVIQGTQLIELRYNDTDPQRAKTVVDELAHQLVLQAPTSRDQAESGRREFIQKQVEEMQRKIEDAGKKIQELQDSINTTTSARDIADKQQQIATLQGQLSQWQQTYANLIGILTPLSPNFLTVIDKARVPTDPISPNVALNVGLAAIVGMLLAMGAAFLVEYLGDTVKSVDEVPKSLGLSVLGTIGRIGGEGRENKLVSARHPRSPYAEAFRVLRTNIQVADVDKPIKTLLVTSANPVEGKSVTAANLAVVMAQAGLRVLLVDADMRRPVQHKLFSQTNDYGLTESLLQATPTLDGFVHKTEVENLLLLPTGQLPPNPAELLGSQRMHSLIELFKAEEDIIIFDSPPCLPLADAAILARQVDGVILVVDADKTRRDAAVSAKEAIQRAGGRILGVALNRVTSRSGGYYYHYYYSDDGERKRKSPASPRPAPQMPTPEQLTPRSSRNDNG